MIGRDFRNVFIEIARLVMRLNPNMNPQIVTVPARTSQVVQKPLVLSRLPAIQRRPVFVFRHRADGSFQALARLTTLPCLAQSDGWQDPSGLLPWMRLADSSHDRPAASHRR